mmetsp:Transcript_46569/g.72544  ORF Transcript_46569/g.72544 Transcript_46569/m.72544 type:complete len:375 (+) Transcript_46569:44-1168(+)
MYEAALVLACWAIRHTLGYAYSSQGLADGAIGNSSIKINRHRCYPDAGALAPPAALASVLLSQVQALMNPQHTRRVTTVRDSRVAPTVAQSEPSGDGTPLPSGDWELDFYSRPVQGMKGKKLWELLVTDSTSSFRHVEPVPPNSVNSKELRSRVQRLIRASEVPPTRIRYFRGQMKNMINIALKDFEGVSVTASRTTYTLQDWLAERERDVYPSMPGYREPRPQQTLPPIIDKLPDIYRAEKFDILTVELGALIEASQINEPAVRSFCPLPVEAANAPLDTPVAGLVLYSNRAEILANLLGSQDICGVGVSLRDGLYIEEGLSTAWLLANLKIDAIKKKAEIFADSKKKLGGYHFMGVYDLSTGDPRGFWTLRT